MPTYKGNAGHLMQHWTLCELLEVAARKGVTGLNYIDAHAMAPLATERQAQDDLFDYVKNCSPSSGESAYELAWRQLAPHGGYPNSAAFVEQVWKGDFSMLLCETDRATCQEIEPWLQRVADPDSCKATELFCGDWLSRFEKGLPSPADVGLADGSLTLVLFDPDMYNRNWRPRNSRNLYPEDLETAMCKMDRLDGCVLIQLSTYDVNDNNPQGAVISSVNQILVANDFQLLAVVRLDGRMMSLVCARNVSWADELADLPDRFDKWLTVFKPSRWPLRRRWVKHLHPDRVKLRRCRRGMSR